MKYESPWRDVRLKDLTVEVRNGVWGDDPGPGDATLCIRGTDFDRVANRVDVSTAPRRAIPPATLRQHRLQPGDLILEKSGGSADQPVGNVALFNRPCEAVVSNFNARMRIAPGVDPRFACYVFTDLYARGLTKQFIKQVTGIQNLDAEAFLSTHVRVPPVEEQHRVAHFLDEATASIDAVMKMRARTLALLRERNRARIDALVRGVEASGCKFTADYMPLGEVPARWGQGKLRNLSCTVQTGPFGSQLHADEYVEDGWPVVNPANIRPGGLRADTRVTVDDLTRERLARHVLKVGDIVFGRRGELGRAGIVTTREAGWVCGTGSLRVRFDRSSFDPEYLYRYLSVPAVRHYFEMSSVGSTMANLNTGILMRMPLLFPSLQEQGMIASGCAAVESEGGKLAESVAAQSALLAERRQALIASAVSGRIDASAASGGAI